MIVIASILLSRIGDLERLFEGNVAVFPIVLLAIGIASFLISFFGCCGAIKESACLLYTVRAHTFSNDSLNT